MKLIKLICVLSVLWNASMVKGEEVRRDSIVSLLKEAYERDQNPRRTIDSLMRNGITDGNKYLPAIEQQEKADSTNLTLVLPLIDTIYEFQLYDLDSIAYNSCWIIIQHAPDSILYKYEDFINQLVARKLISVNSYMAYIDRLKTRQSKAQIYGSQFKMFPNGLFIQFPISNGYKDRWQELGREYNESYFLPKEYKTQHDYMTCINDTQFAILGIICNAPSTQTDKITPLSGVSILVNGIETNKTDSMGFFRIIVDKQDLPVNIEAVIDNIPVQYTTVQNKEIDYIFLTGFFDENTIDVVDE